MYEPHNEKMALKVVVNCKGSDQTAVLTKAITVFILFILDIQME